MKANQRITIRNINSNVGSISINHGADGVGSPPNDVILPSFACCKTSSANLLPITSFGTYDLNLVFVSFTVPSTAVSFIKYSFDILPSDNSLYILENSICSIFSVGFPENCTIPTMIIKLVKIIKLIQKQKKS